MQKNPLLAAILTLMLGAAVVAVVTLTLVPRVSPAKADSPEASSVATADSASSLAELGASLDATAYYATRVKGTVAMTVNNAKPFMAGCFPEVWDMTRGDLVITYRYDARGMEDSKGALAHALANFGVRQVYSPAATVRWENPVSPCDSRWGSYLKGAWLATDYNMGQDALSSTVTTNNQFNQMDKLILQKSAGGDETKYNELRTRTNPLAFQKIALLTPFINKGVWFDRDGAPGVAPGTFNTGGQYYVTMTLHAETTSVTGLGGVAMLKINGNFQSFISETLSSPTLVSPVGMRFSVAAAGAGGIHPALTRMFVLYNFSGSGAKHTVQFKNIKIQGYLVQP
jgi:hypothetical protein